MVNPLDVWFGSVGLLKSNTLPWFNFIENHANLLRFGRASIFFVCGFTQEVNEREFLLSSPVKQIGMLGTQLQICCKGTKGDGWPASVCFCRGEVFHQTTPVQPW